VQNEKEKGVLSDKEVGFNVTGRLFEESECREALCDIAELRWCHLE